MRKGQLNKNLTEAKMKQGLNLAARGKSFKVIFKTLGLSYSSFHKSLKKSNCLDIHKEWYENLYATSLEFWEDLFLQNMNDRNFRTSGWIFSMKTRFRKEYSQSVEAEKVPTPISINIQNNIPQAITSEEQLKEVEKESLKELLDNTPNEDLESEGK